MDRIISIYITMPFRLSSNPIYPLDRIVGQKCAKKINIRNCESHLNWFSGIHASECVCNSISLSKLFCDWSRWMQQFMLPTMKILFAHTIPRIFLAHFHYYLCFLMHQLRVSHVISLAPHNLIVKFRLYERMQNRSIILAFIYTWTAMRKANSIKRQHHSQLLQTLWLEAHSMIEISHCLTIVIRNNILQKLKENSVHVLVEFISEYRRPKIQIHAYCSTRPLFKNNVDRLVDHRTYIYIQLTVREAAVILLTSVSNSQRKKYLLFIIKSVCAFVYVHLTLVWNHITSSMVHSIFLLSCDTHSKV